MIECVSDEMEMCSRYVEMINGLLSESGLNIITNVYLNLMMKEGYTIISVDLRERHYSRNIDAFGTLEKVDAGVLVHVEPLNEGSLPLIMGVLRGAYGTDGAHEHSRFEIFVSNQDLDSVRSLIVEEKDVDVTSDVIAIMDLMSPEGFKISKMLKIPTRLTLLCSQYQLREGWIQKMEEVHGRCSH